MEIPIAKVRSDNDLEKIMQNLDSLFLDYESTKTYATFKISDQSKRSFGVHFADFIIKFEQLHSRFVKHNIELPETVKKHFLLNAANMK